MNKETKTIVGIAAATIVVLAVILFVAGAAAGAAYLLTRDNARSQDNFALSEFPGNQPLAAIFTASTSLRQPSMVMMKDEQSRNRFSLSGELQELKDDSLVVAGQTIQLAGNDFDRSALQAGSFVVVQGSVDSDGTLVAETVYPVGSEETGYSYVVTGQVDSIDGKTMVVEGKPITLIDDTSMPQDIGVDDQVAVKGIILEKGDVVATDVQHLEDITTGGGDVERQFEFEGKVESINPWTVAGVDLAVDNNTQVAGGIQVGSPVIVRGVILEDGTWMAREISLISTEPAEIVVVFIGTVENTNPWIVNGTTLTVGDDVVIGDGIAAGSLVRVEAVLRADGTYAVRSIQRIDERTQEGCFRITDVLTSIEGNRLRLQKWPEFVLAEDVNLQGDLRPGSLVLVTVCVLDDHTLSVRSVTVVDQVRDDDNNNDHQGENKVTICHIPPGNPGNRHTITVGESAVQAHISNHGDTLGPCP